ncbi:MAG: hypothetical protein RLZZ584_150 [Pseudomonadota bacterium]|jgi:hypothetical protein
MNRLLIVLTLALSGALPVQAAEPAPNGITLPEGYKDWRLLSTHFRTENNTIRAVLGNDVAIKAAREGKTNPWPEGAVLAKMVWKARKHEKWETAMEPGDFVHAEFMTKNSAKFASTGGWGYARWLGQDQKPYGKDAGFTQECVGCHTPVKDNDWVYTHPVKLP